MGEITRFMHVTERTSQRAFTRSLSGITSIFPNYPERHNPTAISSLRIGQARLLAARLPRCPWCGTDGRAAL